MSEQRVRTLNRLHPQAFSRQRKGIVLCFAPVCTFTDAPARCLLAQRVRFEGRDVRADDKAEVGIVDLEDDNRWMAIGESTAWNWRQGNRLQWIP